MLLGTNRKEAAQTTEESRANKTQMIRISNEDGRSAAARNIGRLALFIIPAALGIAAAIWLGVWIQAHYFLIDRAQEGRRGSAVGAPDPERAAYIIDLPSADIKVDRVDIENGQMTVLFHNPLGSHWVKDLQLHWQWFAPDNTALADHWDNSRELNGPTELDPGEKGIVTEKDLRPDARAAGVTVWFVHN